MRRLLLMAAISCAACSVFYDEGARFANQVADFAWDFRASPRTEAVFEYVPLYGNRQHIRAGIGRIHWCPKPPCDGNGAATVWVERGQSGTGYRIATAASVPQPLDVEKDRGPIRVHMRKAGREVEIVALD
jgi:hypothetical protein